MFYSHNLLSKKGPYGTVWAAAHHLHKLKKSNIVTVNISSTIEQIMYPQVPMALRLNGLLLFGVVKLYERKVEYLHHDCNVLRIDISKAYTKTNINLPEDANQAKYESITLPDNFALDLIEIDFNNLNRSPDNHLRLNEDITLTDYSPVSFLNNRHGTPAGYVMISVGEDESSHPSISRYNPAPESNYVEEISHPQTPPSTINDFQAPDPNHHSGFSDIFMNISPPETLRNNNINLQKSPRVSSVLPDEVEPDLELVNKISELNNKHLSNLNEIPESVQPSSLPKQSSPQQSVHYEDDPVHDNLGPPVSFELAPSPPSAKRCAELAPSPPRTKRRRIKYDKATVLTNEFMKKSIDDASRLKRKRKGVSSFLDVFRLNNANKKQKVLFDPLISGLCDNLSQVIEDGFVSSKAHLINTEQADPDAVEVDRFNNFNDPFDNNTIPISSPFSIPFSSPHTVDKITPGTTTDVWSKGTSVGPTTDPTSSIVSFISEVETPISQSQHGFDKSGGLFDIAEEDNAEELAFMEDDQGTPGLVGTPRGSSLLPRTRCLAKLIKEKSAATPSTSESYGSVSMKSILQGKTRKVCSRMFFETLVLKSCDLIDVKQDEPYGDISLKVTQKLSKLDFSN